VVTRARAQTAPRVALAADDDRTAAEVARVAAERGVPVERLSIEAAIGAPVGAIAYAPAAAPDAGGAAALARLTAAAAENRRPVVLLAAFARARGRAAEERAVVLAYLRAHGAVPVDDPDAWFETAVLLAAYGAPAGSRLALVAPPGGWLAAQATALAVEEEARAAGGRLVHPAAGDDELPADLVLVDGRLDAPTPQRVGRAIVVPVVARGELLPSDGRTALVGLRAALAAAGIAARHAERMAQGLGPAAAADGKKLKPDRARADKALAAAGERLGDHETKLLLSAYGCAVTRQAVAATPSALVRYAQTLGWPVEIKAWDPATPGEREGHEVLIAGVRNPPDARRAFASAATGAGLAVGVPVIVRPTPPPGRELAARFERHAALGWTALVEVPGASGPLASPAPLRRADADELAAALEASRSGDAPPDRAALAELLLRASFAAAHAEEQVEALELGRVIVGKKGEGALVVDARMKLRRRR
jgi:hypothetical protein